MKAPLRLPAAALAVLLLFSAAGCVPLGSSPRNEGDPDPASAPPEEASSGTAPGDDPAGIAVAGVETHLFVWRNDAPPAPWSLADTYTVSAHTPSPPGGHRLVLGDYRIVLFYQADAQARAGPLPLSPGEVVEVELFFDDTLALESMAVLRRPGGELLAALWDSAEVWPALPEVEIDYVLAGDPPAPGAADCASISPYVLLASATPGDGAPLELAPGTGGAIGSWVVGNGLSAFVTGANGPCADLRSATSGFVRAP